MAKQVTDARSAASAAQAKRDGSRKAIEDAEERKGAAVETLRASLGRKLPADVLGEIERRRATLSEADEALATAQAAADSSRDRRDETERDVVGAQKAVAGYEASLAAVRASAKGACLGLANELAGEGLPDLPTESDEHGFVTAAWRTYCDAHSKTAEKRVHTLRTELEKVAGRLAKVATEIGLDLNGALPSEALSRFGDAVTDAHGAVVGAEKDLSALLDRIKTRERLEKAIAKEQQERVLYRQLADELRSDRFIGFVLEESMNQLADQASLELLRISDDRYSLAAEGGDFDVIDHTNADERRSVATLSGGETFLASLSLALALSAGLREFARTAAARLDAIFIDEGFGALDPETLEVVVDALERLRDGDRMVGVITHVPTLAERIPAGLRVEATGGSSLITVRN
jgi:DNA repair protein SbcC/Rad50